MYGKRPDGILETIRDRELIAAQIKELCAAHTSLQVNKTWDASEGFASRFMAPHESGDILIYPPKKGAGSIIKASDDVVVNYASNNARFEFDSWVVEETTGSGASLRLSRPLALRRVQVRRYQRIRLAEDSSLAVSILRHGTNAMSLRGKIVDLGEGGMGSNVDSPEGLSVGMEVDRLLFALPDGYTIYAPATVRNIFPLHGTDGELLCYRCGMQFEKLENRQRRALAAFIFKKQHESIGRRRSAR
ncbi:MAG: PilZ domain-containing protein [Nitrospirota bacterium]|nr:PilZ domain-containing protein [Nitrospirota bacterium]